MNEARDTDTTGTFDDGHDLDPGEASRLVEQTSRQARRAFDPSSPLAAVVGSGVFLVGYGAVWWSIRNQPTYSGPAGWAVAVLYGMIAVGAIVGGTMSRRRTAGVGGRARRRLWAQAVAVWAAGIGAWTVEGALRYLGVPFKIVYGVYGPTVPLMALAAAAAGIAAMREAWPELGLCVAIIAVASVSTFFGPAGAWGLTGLGCAVALLVYAATIVWLRDRATPQP